MFSLERLAPIALLCFATAAVAADAPKLGQAVSPAYVMIVSSVVALAGSLAVQRYGSGELDLT